MSDSATVWTVAGMSMEFHRNHMSRLMAQLVKNLPALRETWVRSLSWEDPLEKGMATTPVVWPGEFHGRYSPWRRKKSDMTE